MKKLIKVLMLILVISIIGEAQSKYPCKTIKEIQFVHPYSLLVADQIQTVSISIVCKPPLLIKLKKCYW